MSSALSHSSSRSIATRVMYGVALVALLAFGVAAAASYLRSSQALLTGARATMEGLASLEYGVRFLGVPLVMVLGHSSCGAVSAAVSVVQQQAQLPGHLPALAEAIRPAVELAAQRDPAHVHAAATEGNVRHQVARLATADPLLAPQVKSGALQVVGALYALETGRVMLV